jgi:ABC-type antimicrobial peptide transport system permease subunit
VLKEGIVLATAGVVLGTGGAYLLARGLRSLLFEVSATDATTYAGAALFLTVVAVLACLIPSMRASRVDPVSALRQE